MQLRDQEALEASSMPPQIVGTTGDEVDIGSGNLDHFVIEDEEEEHLSEGFEYISRHDSAADIGTSPDSGVKRSRDRAADLLDMQL